MLETPHDPTHPPTHTTCKPQPRLCAFLLAYPHDRNTKSLALSHCMLRPCQPCVTLGKMRTLLLSVLPHRQHQIPRIATHTTRRSRPGVAQSPLTSGCRTRTSTPSLVVKFIRVVHGLGTLSPANTHNKLQVPALEPIPPPCTPVLEWCDCPSVMLRQACVWRGSPNAPNPTDCARTCPVAGRLRFHMSWPCRGVAKFCIPPHASAVLLRSSRPKFKVCASGTCLPDGGCCQPPTVTTSEPITPHSLCSTCAHAHCAAWHLTLPPQPIPFLLTQ